jgi:hypothetical protein
MEFQAPKKPECYSPGRTKSYAEIAENDCFTCLERATCLDFVKDTMELKQFLNLLDKDIESNPQNIRPLTEPLVGQLGELVGNIEIDLDAPLVDEEEPKKTTQQDFDSVAAMVIDFLSSRNHPASVQDIVETFENDDLPIFAERVALQLIADRVLYFTEDRKVGISRKHQPYPHLQFPPPLPTPDQIIALAVSMDLVYENSYGGACSPYVEDSDIRDIVVDFATKLLYTYGNLP